MTEKQIPMTKPLSVLVTGIGGGGHGEQILKALRLAGTPYRITGTDTDPLSANRPLVDDFAVVPPAGHPEYLETILELARAHEALAVFHGSEAEMMVLSRARDRLEAAGFYVPVNPLETMEICQDKVRLARYLSEHGFAVPRFREVQNIADIADFDVFPAIVKPSIGGGGSANVLIAQSRTELETFCAYLLKLYPRFLVQEYVGTPENEFTVGVLFGRDGVLINSIGIRRIISNALSLRTRVPNISGRAGLGPTLVVSSGISQGEVGRWPEVTAQCERIAAVLRPQAPVNIQCRLVDGVVIPFEINPRFSGTTSLRALAGYNEPDVLFRRDVLGEKIEDHFAYREITVMRGLQETVIDAQVAPASSLMG